MDERDDEVQNSANPSPTHKRILVLQVILVVTISILAALIGSVLKTSKDGVGAPPQLKPVSLHNTQIEEGIFVVTLASPLDATYKRDFYRWAALVEVDGVMAAELIGLENGTADGVIEFADVDGSGSFSDEDAFLVDVQSLDGTEFSFILAYNRYSIPHAHDFVAREPLLRA